MKRFCFSLAALLVLSTRVASAQADPKEGVSVRFVDTDLRVVVQALGRYLTKPVISANVPAVKVNFETPAPVPRSSVALLLRELLQSNGLVMEEDSTVYRVAPKPAEPPPVAAMPVSAPAASNTGPVQLHVIRLKHARAADVAATVNLLFGGGGEFSGRSGVATPTLSDQLRQNMVPPSAPGQGPGAAGPAPAKASALVGATVIVPDELTNSLLVRASVEDFGTLRAAVDQLDIRPLQVLIEVLIVEARRDKSFSFGADLFLPKQGLGDGTTIQGRSRGGGIGDLVIEIMRLGKANIDAVLRSSEARGDVQIISRPVLLASNNTEARFLVGSQRPFVQVSRSLPTDAPARDQVVQYKDVGTKLTVRPTINQDGYVSLTIQQEISSATGETQFEAPVISTREASTQVLVRDSQTVVLGGLRDQQRDRAQSGIPILSGIPIIGGIFGTASRRQTSTELYLFLTPRIIRSDEDAEALTKERMPKGVER